VIEVLVRRASDGAISEITVTGHAGWAEPGKDLVCAGVSALVVTALIGLKKVTGHPHEGKATAGRMYCKLLPGGTADSALKAQALLETIVLGLSDMAKDYKQFIKVTEGG